MAVQYQYKTPGVYVQELDAFPPSIVGVETAVPVFIGYTKTAEKAGRSVKLRPVRISSMVEYVAIFGDAPNYQFTLTPMLTTAADVAIAKAASDKAAADKTAAAAKATAATADPDKTAAQKAAADAATAATTASANLTKVTAAYAATSAGKADAIALASEKARDDAATALKANPTDLTLQKNANDTAKKASDDRTAANAAVAADSKAVPHDVTIGGKSYGLVLDRTFYFYNSLRLFYANGGGDCYIVSVGSYDDASGGITLTDLTAGLDAVRDLVGPTMLVIPEAAELKDSPHATLAEEMLKQCYDKQDRVAILDVWGLDTLASNFSPSDLTDAISPFRTAMATVNSLYLKYGMAYAPFLNTSVVDPSEVSFMNFATGSRDELKTVIEGEVTRLFPDAKISDLETGFFAQLQAIDAMPEGDAKTGKFKQLNQNLIVQVPVFNDIYTVMAAKLGTLPPSGAMAGIYTQNDATRGVWNAPANIGLVTVTGPTIRISNTMQDDLNMPINGLAINAIRDFVGRGTLVWGARTLDGNSNDWRYIQVRRALIYIEQSVELALNKFVFEPNVAQTWVTVTSMISSFLRGFWAAGGLMGATPTEAFTIQCGLGSTMTAQDILEGRMIVQIKLQMVHPAEFIVLAFQQQMQGGT
jgi:Bacteriophage tail sheath protein